MTVCKTCKFPKDIQRNPVFLTDNILSFLEYESNTCEECGHQKDGSTIPIVHDLIQEIVTRFSKERSDLIKFLKHYNFLTEEQRTEVCCLLPRFMKKDYKTPKDEDHTHGDVEEPYSWNVVYHEVIYDTRLAKVLVRDIDWERFKDD